MTQFDFSKCPGTCERIRQQTRREATPTLYGEELPEPSRIRDAIAWVRRFL